MSCLDEAPRESKSTRSTQTPHTINEPRLGTPLDQNTLDGLRCGFCSVTGGSSCKAEDPRALLRTTQQTDCLCLHSFLAKKLTSVAGFQIEFIILQCDVSRKKIHQRSDVDLSVTVLPSPCSHPGHLFVNPRSFLISFFWCTFVAPSLHHSPPPDYDCPRRRSTHRSIPVTSGEDIVIAPAQPPVAGGMCHECSLRSLPLIAPSVDLFVNSPSAHSNAKRWNCCDDCALAGRSSSNCLLCVPANRNVTGRAMVLVLMVRAGCGPTHRESVSTRFLLTEPWHQKQMNGSSCPSTRTVGENMKGTQR